MNTNLTNLDSDLTFTLRNLRRSLGADAEVLKWLREDYRAKRAILVGRGYATKEQLDQLAKAKADSIHGVADPAIHAISQLVTALRYHSGLGGVQADFEASDTRLQ